MTAPAHEQMADKFTVERMLRSVRFWNRFDRLWIRLTRTARAKLLVMAAELDQDAAFYRRCKLLALEIARGSVVTKDTKLDDLLQRRRQRLIKNAEDALVAYDGLIREAEAQASWIRARCR